MNDDALVLMPTAGQLLRAAEAVHRSDGAAAEAELAGNLQSAFGTGVTICATFDLATRLGQFVGASIAMGASLAKAAGEDPSPLPLIDAPKHLRAAIAVGNAISVGNAAEGMALFLEQVNLPDGPDDDGWAGRALVLALEVLHSTLSLSASDKGGKRELRA